MSTRTFAPTNYTAVSGYFRQTSESLNQDGERTFDPAKEHFGLIDHSESRWIHFKKSIDELNANADASTVYKVFFVARHGEGWHNVAEAKYGTKAWDEHWSMLTGDGELTWGPDPELTPKGIGQAREMNKAWKEELAAGAPLPQFFYSSPFQRSARTLEITWNDIVLNKGVRPLIKEGFRETIGLHTCDKRRTRSEIARDFPFYDIEPSFAEHDELWSPDWQESPRQQALRTQQMLNEVFATNSSQYISITAHSGTINAFLRVVNHRPVAVGPGGMIPVVVRASNDPSQQNELLAGGQSVARPHPTTKA